MAWPSLGSAVETPWLALVGHCCPPTYAQENSLIALHGARFRQGSLGKQLLAECHDYS